MAVRDYAIAHPFEDVDAAAISAQAGMPDAVASQPVERQNMQDSQQVADGSPSASGSPSADSGMQPQQHEHAERGGNMEQSMKMKAVSCWRIS